MKTAKRYELSECELLVMKVIWDAGEAVTCQEIIADLKSKFNAVYKDTTVYTFIKILKEKGFVDSYRRGVTFFFAARTEEEYKKKVVQTEKDFWFEGSIVKMAAALFASGSVTAEEKQELKSMIDELD